MDSRAILEIILLFIAIFLFYKWTTSLNRLEVMKESNEDLVNNLKFYREELRQHEINVQKRIDEVRDYYKAQTKHNKTLREENKKLVEMNNFLREETIKIEESLRVNQIQIDTLRDLLKEATIKK